MRRNESWGAWSILVKISDLARPFLTRGIPNQMRRKKVGILTRTRESLVLIPPKITCWEIHLYLLKMPAYAATPSAKKSLMSLRTTTTPSSFHLTSPSHLSSPLY